MMKEKKTEVITFRTDKPIKEMLDETAKLNQWSVSQVVAAIVQNWAINPNPTRIVVKTKELLEVIEEIKEDNKEAVEISIDMIEDSETEIEEKCLMFATLECGGRGYCGDYERIREITPEEIRQIQ